MTKKQVEEIIDLFRDRKYGLENAELVGVSVDEFVTMFHAYRAVNGNKLKKRFTKTPMMQWLFREKDMTIEAVALLFGVTEGYTTTVCYKEPEYSIPRDFGVKKRKPGRTCSSGAVFSKDDYGKDKFRRSK